MFFGALGGNRTHVSEVLEASAVPLSYQRNSESIVISFDCVNVKYTQTDKHLNVWDKYV